MAERTAYQVRQKHCSSTNPVSLETTRPNQRIGVVREKPKLSIEASKHGICPYSQSWRPFWYRRRILGVFLFYFATIFGALQAVLVYSEKHGGIVSVSDNYLYLWTYGPTAISMLGLAFWNRVDYRVRQMAPWVTLNLETEKHARFNILVDYLSPTAPEILWYAVNNRDWLVATSTVAGLVQSMLTVVSTAIFAAAPQWIVVEDLNVTVTSKFDHYRSSWSVYDQATYIYDAIHALNLSYPFGTAPEFAYQSFVVDADMHDRITSRIELPVETISLDLDCEDASLTWEDSTCLGLYDLNSPSNIMLHTNECTTSFNFYGIFGPRSINGDTEAFALFSDAQCWLQSAQSGSRLSPRIGIAYAQVAHVKNASLTGQESSLNTWRDCKNPNQDNYFNITASRQWICSATIRTSSAIVSANLSDIASGNLPDFRFENNGSFRILPDSKNYSVGTLTSPSTGLMDSVPVPNHISSLVPQSMPNTQRILAYGAGLSQDVFATTDAFLTIAKKHARAMFAQRDSKLWTVPEDTIVLGSRSVLKTRLVARKMPVRTMQAMLTLSMLVVITCIALIPSHHILPYDIACLSGLCAMLATSSEYVEIFRGTGMLNVQGLEKRLNSLALRTTFDPDTQNCKLTKSKIEATNQPDCNKVTENETADHRSIHRSWQPLAIAIQAQFIVALIVIAVIVSLQTLLKVSDDRQGFLDVSTTFREHSAWALIPAGLMIAVSLYLGAVDTAYRTFAPYVDLRRGTNTCKALHLNYLSHIQIETLVLSLRCRHFAVSAATAAAILSSFLTIVVSGIFSVSQITTVNRLPIVQTSWFEESGVNDSGYAQNSALVSGLILMANLNYPPWTYKDLAFGSINFSSEVWQRSDTSLHGTLKTVIPAIRSSLNCSFYDKADIPDLFYGLRSDPVWGIFGNVPGDERCRRPSNDLASLYFNGSIPTRALSWFQNLTSGSDCPSLQYIWASQTTKGTFIQNTTNSPDAGGSELPISEFTVEYAHSMTCYEMIEQVDVRVNFTTPSFKIEGTPQILAETSKTFSTALVEAPYEGIRMASYSGLIERVYDISPADYCSLGGTEKIQKAIIELHGILRAQQYNAILRAPIDKSNSSLSPMNGSVTGELHHSDRWRLIQHPISTHILCSILAAILVLCFGAFLRSDTRGVLPKNPSSIAAVSSLLADSNLLSTNSEANRDVTQITSPYLNPIQKIPGQNQGDEEQSLNGLFKMGWFKRESDGQEVFTINWVADATTTMRPYD